MTRRTSARALAALVALGMLLPAATAACPIDIDGNGDVGFSDLLEVLSNWGPCVACPADLDGSGEVDFDDMLLVLSNYGPCSSFTAIELAGDALGGRYPYFTFVNVFNESDPRRIAVDPVVHPEVIDQLGFLWIVAPKTAAEWDADPMLVDVRGAPQGVLLTGTDIQDAVSVITGALDGDGGVAFGVGYDIVLDYDIDGILSTGDFIDGYGDEPGLTVVKDTTTPGPLAVTQIQYSGGTFLGQRTYYPTDVATLGELPLVVISHGNGHQYTWYDYLGQHLASYGYVVMSHQNNTQPGIETASTTTLTNTDYFLGNLGTIAGGALQGHVDSGRIIWVGHSRGGEGVARAYDRLFDGTYSASQFTIDDIALISSIAPTDFLGTNSANPHGVPYHLIYGAADGDVSGSADCDLCQSFHLLERATGFRASTYLHGADHNDFNCCGFNDYDGPSGEEIGRNEAQEVTKGAYLALIKHVIDGSGAAKEFLWRQYESLRPVGVALTTTVDREYKDALEAGDFVLDDFQTQSAVGVSSSGGAVSFDVADLTEGKLNDSNSTFTWVASDPMNGMTRARGSDTSRGIVFGWSADAFLEFEVVPGERDFSDKGFVSLRACQGTRHPDTIGIQGNATFTVTLRDGAGTSSSIGIGVYGGGVEEPFPRPGAGSGVGWQNEFETIRIRLRDFLIDGSGLDLTDVVAVRLDFGPSSGDARGRLGLDDVRITTD